MGGDEIEALYTKALFSRRCAVADLESVNLEELHNRPIKELMNDVKIRSLATIVIDSIEVARDVRFELPGSVKLTLRPLWLDFVLKVGGRPPTVDFVRLLQLVELDATGIILRDLSYLCAMNNPPVWHAVRTDSPEYQTLLALIRSRVSSTTS